MVSATATLNENNGWYTVFENLDANKNYTIKEITPTDYTVSYSGSMSEGYVITNTYTEGSTDPGDIPDPDEPTDPETASVTISKIWDDNDDAAAARPESVIVYLITGGSVYREAELNADNGWKYTFTELPADLTYTFMEYPVTDYTAVYGGSASEGFTVTNTYTPGSTIIDDPTDPSEPEPDPSPESTEEPTSEPTATPKPTKKPSPNFNYSTPTPTAAPSEEPTSAPDSDTSADSTAEPDTPTDAPSGGDPGTDIPNDTDMPNDTDTTDDADTSDSDTSEIDTTDSSDTEEGEPVEPDDASPDDSQESPPREQPVTLIPQTGENYIPIYVLSGVGVLFVIVGLIMIFGGGSDERKKNR